MKKEWRIPTLVGLFLIIIGLIATAFLTNQAQRFFLKASPTATPSEVKITNISESSFSVSFITPDVPVSAAVAYGTSGSLGQTATDDRVQAGVSEDRFTTHHVTVRFLKPATKYFFKIISGSQTYDNQGVPYSVVTAPSIATVNTPTNPIYGTILRADKTPASGVIVYLTVKNSTPLSTLTKSSGSWLLTLNNARTSDLLSYVGVNPKGDPENIFVQGAKDGVATAQTITGNDAPVPTIVLGQTYDFSSGYGQNSVAQITPSATPTLSVSPQATTSFGLSGEKSATSSPILVSPLQNAVLTDTKPTFSGQGKPGQTITITVRSDTVYSATVVVDANGRWSWAPPGNLTPGQHSVTIASADTGGSPVNVSQNFTVLASGTQVTESATPSATLTPTPTASPSAMPKSGNSLPTYILFFSGVVIIILGAFFYAAI